ncbi:MAG: hypothetical protein M3271_09740, partial [Actinomycetota bacterium]|nr:hypothetical protein [Actinomycetota bacterium]
MKRARAAAVVTVAFLLCLAPVAGSGAAARVTFGPEVAVAERLPVPVGGEQQQPQVAAGDGGFLAVWEDDRSCCGRTIYGARLDRDGEPLDRFGIRMSDPTGYSEWDPDVVWSGRDYVVAWDDSGSGIDFARVSSEGEVRDSPPRDLDVEGATGMAPAVASTGAGTLIVWVGCVYQGADCDSALYGAVVEPDGAVRGPFVMIHEPPSLGAPAVAAGRDGYLVTWATSSGPDRGIHAARVDEAGAVSGAPALVAAGAYEGADIAFAGDHFMVVWNTGDQGLDVLGIRLTPEGAPLDPQPSVIAFGRPVQWNPQVAPDGHGRYYVVWEDRQRGRAVYGTRITSEGEPVRTNGTLVSTMDGFEQEPAVAYDGGVHMVVWTSERRRVRDVYGIARRAGDPPPEDPRPVALGLNVQVVPSVAWNGRVFLVVWADSRESSWAQDIYAARVTAAGRVLDGTGFKVSSSTRQSYEPTVASDGRDFLVAWEDWRNYRDGKRRTDVYGARVLGDGRVVERDLPISTARDYQQNVELAWTGSSYLAVWEDLRSGVVGDFTGHADLYSTRVTRAGRVVHPRGRAVAVARRNHGTAALVAREGRVFLSWTEGCHAWREEECKRDVLATRLTRGGRPVGETIAVAATGASESYSAVLIGPRGYYVVWTRAKDGRKALVGRRLTSRGRLTRPRV